MNEVQMCVGYTEWHKSLDTLFSLVSSDMSYYVQKTGYRKKLPHPVTENREGEMGQYDLCTIVLLC
jgi:hypothetical protein